MAEFKIPVTARSAGVIIPYPLAVDLVDGEPVTPARARVLRRAEIVTPRKLCRMHAADVERQAEALGTAAELLTRRRVLAGERERRDRELRRLTRWLEDRAWAKRKGRVLAQLEARGRDAATLEVRHRFGSVMVAGFAEPMTFKVGL